MTTNNAINREQRREIQRSMRKENATYPAHLIQINAANLDVKPPLNQIAVWRSRDFLVQVFSADSPCVARLSINRTMIAGKSWKEDISWEDLQRLKSECGYGLSDAVEVFPKDTNVVNVANMRHLWVMAEKLPFAWKNK